MKRKKFDSDPLFSDKYLKTKTKSYNETINTSFINIDNKSTKPPNEWIKYVFLSVIVTDAMFELIKHYCLESLVGYGLENFSSNNFEEEKAKNFEENLQ